MMRLPLSSVDSTSAKRALAEQVVGTGEGWIIEMSTKELREVIALRADAVED